ncbi:hypothetical protein VNO78_32382 [Psophocarpus tetragonolobus]|uniref:Transmembrane protein n=1 Tax=Psophocarpus tetragonolobus TaxID=3891 RepID=A0AAN9NWT8_PSOTE
MWCARPHPQMGSSVAVGSVIRCGNTSIATPYTRLLLLPHFPSFSTPTRTRTRRKIQLVCGAKTQIKEQLDDDVLTSKIRKLVGKEPDFWEGEQWEWFGIFAKYLWIFGFVFGAIFAVYGFFTFQEPPKEVKEKSERLYGVQSGKRSNVDSYEEADVDAGVESNDISSDIFEEPDVYDSDVFESNPTEVAPSLE